MPNEFQRRVLVIDDNTSIHADFIKILGTPNRPSDDDLGALAASMFGGAEATSKSGPRLTYEIATASQGQEGLAKAEAAFQAQRPFHLAFVDIRMPPGWDGIETIERLW